MVQDPAELERAVVAELKRRGYGIDWRPNVHMALTKGTGVYREFDGAERRVSAGAITKEQWIRAVMQGGSIQDLTTRIIEMAEKIQPPQKRPQKKRKKVPADGPADEKSPAADIDPEVLELARVLSIARNPPKAKPRRGRPKKSDVQQQQTPQ